MKITSLEIFKMDMNYTYVLTTSLGTIPSAENILIKINTDIGIVGWGEGAPILSLQAKRRLPRLKQQSFWAN